MKVSQKCLPSDSVRTKFTADIRNYLPFLLLPPSKGLDFLPSFGLVCEIAIYINFSGCLAQPSLKRTYGGLMGAGVTPFVLEVLPGAFTDEYRPSCTLNICAPCSKSHCRLIKMCTEKNERLEMFTNHS